MAFTFIEFDSAFVHRADVKYHAADALAEVQTDSEYTTDVVDDLSVCNIELTKIRDEKISQLHLCTKCIVVTKPKTGKQDNDRM